MKSCPKCGVDHAKPGIFCSRHCANSRGPMSEDQKRFRSAYALANPKGAVTDHAARVRGGKARQIGRKVPRVLVACRCGIVFLTPADSRLQKFHNRACAKRFGAIGGYQPNSTRVHRSIYNGATMSSGAERAFAMLLDRHGVRWIKNETTSFPFVNLEGKPRRYYPDFFLPDYDMWIEIKGKKYVRPDDHLRLQAVGNIERIFSHQLRLPDCVTSASGDHRASLMS